MKEIKNTCYKGTRILLGNDKQEYLRRCRELLLYNGYNEISLPIIQETTLFKDKVGGENQKMMYSVIEPGGRDLCLAPEYTAVIQELSKTYFKNEKDVKLFYVQECFRGEKPQAGRYRQFTQLGVEILNPTKEYDLGELAYDLIEIMGYILWKKQKMDKRQFDSLFTITYNVSRGLDYYKDGKGFEIICESLGSSKQVCGGGKYEGGIGFAIGVDRILNLL